MQSSLTSGQPAKRNWQQRLRLYFMTTAGALVMMGCVTGGSNAGDGTKITYPEPKSGLGQFLAGEIARSDRDTRSARHYFGKALKQDPENQILQNRALLLFLAEGEINNALELADKSSKDREAPSIANIALAVNAVSEKRWAEANGKMDAVAKSGLSDFIAPLFRAWTTVATKNSEAAEKVLDKMPKRRSFTLFASYHRALILQHAGKPDQAITAIDKAISLGGKNAPRLVYTQITLKAATGDWEGAKKIAQEFLARFPGQSLLNYAYAKLLSNEAPEGLIKTPQDGVAEIFLGVGRYLSREPTNEFAKVYYRLAYHAAGGHDQALVYLGETLEEEENWKAAADVYLKVPAKSPFSWRSRIRVANTLSEQERIDDAISVLKGLAKNSPQDVEALMFAGRILNSKKRYIEAAELFSSAVLRVSNPRPFHWQLFYNRGISYERSKQWPKAEKDFLTALRLKPEQPRVLNYLGYSWVDQGLYLKRARDMIQRAVKQRPNDGYIIDSLGWVLYKMGDYEGAVTQLERAVELLPNDPILNDHLGDAYWQVGRRLEARFQWNHALAFEPEPAEIPKIKKKLRDGLKTAQTQNGDKT